MSTSHRDAASILMERFPQIGLALTVQEGRKDPLAFLQKADLLYIYGIEKAFLYFQYKEWLHKEKERNLVFLEKDLSRIAEFLHLPFAQDILSDPQVHFEHFSLKNIDLLVHRFPAACMECIGPKPLALKLMRKTALAYGAKVDRVCGHVLFRNFIEHCRFLSSSYYGNRLKGAFQNIPAVVCGAGPSLEESLDTLKTLENKALIIAGGSTIAALSSRGIMPHFGVATDPNFEEVRRFKNSFAFEMPLVYSMRVHPGIFHTINGPFVYIRSGMGGLSELWLDEEAGLQEDPIGAKLSSEAISVTLVAIAWAQYLGCSPILLNGIDLAYTNNQHYAAGVTECNQIREEKDISDRILQVKDKNKEMTQTAVRWLMEARSIADFAKKHPQVAWIDTTSQGLAIEGISFQPLSQAASTFLERDNLREKVLKEIFSHPMPAIAFEAKGAEILQSLQRAIDCLKVLAGEVEGSKALAEIELEEELATRLLFYDVKNTIKEKEKFWNAWLIMARLYLHCLDNRGAYFEEFSR